MALSKLQVSGYRGFSDSTEIKFAIPTGLVGSGLSIITGPNNSGKSSIIECLRARNGHSAVSFTSGVRNSTQDEVYIEYHIDGSVEFIKSIRKGSSETIRQISTLNRRIFVLPSRRAFNPYFGKNIMSRDNYVDNAMLPPQRSSMLSYFEARLFSIANDPEKFNSLLEKVLGFQPVWTIDQSDQGQYFLKFFNESHSHSSDGMGEGIVSIFSIVDALYDSNPGDIIVIDEPELSLHPSLQKRLYSLIANLASDRQIIISTHSPYFVNISHVINGCSISRVWNCSNKTSVNQLTMSGIKSLKKISSINIYNPHIFGLDARELFFQEDKIILTEGQEDVLLYPKIATQIGEQINGNFFGWGAGGAGNIEHLCRIMQDLGFKKVAALLDGDKVSESIKLKKKFPKFHFECIPAKDIRTKSRKNEVDPVDGILDEKLKLKKEFESDMREIFSNLSKHMQ